MRHTDSNERLGADTSESLNGGSDARRLRETSGFVALDIVKDVVARGLTNRDRLPLESEMVQQCAK